MNLDKIFANWNISSSKETVEHVQAMVPALADIYKEKGELTKEDFDLHEIPGKEDYCKTKLKHQLCVSRQRGLILTHPLISAKYERRPLPAPPQTATVAQEVPAAQPEVIAEPIVQKKTRAVAKKSTRLITKHNQPAAEKDDFVYYYKPRSSSRRMQGL